MNGAQGLWACYNLQERLIPHLRGQTAHRLHARGLRQGRIAEHLGVSQAMVSKYLRAPPPAPPGVPAATLHAIVERAVASVVAADQAGRAPAWCPICPTFKPADRDALPQECLRGEGFPDEDDGRRVLESLANAGQRLERLRVAPLAPEVNINLAMATANAKDARGVAAFPGRLVEVRGEVRALAAPEFGVSRHLSEILLRVRAILPDVRAVLCLRDAPSVRVAIRAARLRAKVLPRRHGELLLQLDPRERPDALVDPGDFGIEPITYVLGRDAVETVDKAQTILQHMPNRT